ncbi:hypothetical protein BAY61_08870 [Prauserella marina]|nr:TetR family transcriptional regulator [Prauserella marina]ASR39114.1 hypothetical protein BAY61_08870 [Prauserella marina]
MPTSEPAARSPRRTPRQSERLRDPERTRARIMAAAKEQFAAHGFAATRISDIAEQAEVNKQLISYYFGGKEGLYTEVIAATLRTNASMTANDMPLEEVVAAFVVGSTADPAASRLLMWENLTDSGQDSAEGEAQREFMREQVAYVRGRQREGELAEDIEPAHLLLMLISAASAPHTFSRIARAIFGTEASSAEFAAAYAEQLRRIVRHLSPEGN